MFFLHFSSLLGSNTFRNPVFSLSFLLIIFSAYRHSKIERSTCSEIRRNIRAGCSGDVERR